MTTSRIPAVLDALVTMLKANVTGATVYDGRYVTVPDGDFLTVGWTPDGESPTGQQVWVGVGGRSRTETIDIPCYADSYSGSTDTSTRRTACLALFAAADAAVRADPNLAGTVPSPGWAEIGTYNLREEQTEAGLAVGVVFHVLVTTRI